MTTNIIHNKTLFVAALSVYFGLLIVGAPPHILAQQLEAQTKSANSEAKFDRKPFDDFAREIKQQISEGKVNLDNSFSVAIKANIENSGKLRNTRIIDKTGDLALCNAAIDFVSALSDTGVLGYLHNISPQPSSEITIKLDGIKGDLNLTNSFSAGSVKRAQNLASGLNAALEMQILVLRQADAKARDFLRNIKVSSKDNELTIVTHLPRAALSALLEKSEKAD